MSIPSDQSALIALIALVALNQADGSDCAGDFGGSDGPNESYMAQLTEY